MKIRFMWKGFAAAIVAAVLFSGGSARGEITHAGIPGYPQVGQRPVALPQIGANPVGAPTIVNQSPSVVGFGRSPFYQGGIGSVGGTVANAGYSGLGGYGGIGSLTYPYTGYAGVGYGSNPYYPYASYSSLGCGLGGLGSNWLTGNSLVNPSWYWDTSYGLGGSYYGLGQYWDPYLYNLGSGYGDLFGGLGGLGGLYGGYGYDYGLDPYSYGYGGLDYGLGGYGYGYGDDWGFGFGLGGLGGYGFGDDSGWGFGLGYSDYDYGFGF